MGLQYGMLGTANFASVNGHRGISKRTQRYPLMGNPADHYLDQSRRDDVERV
jgi:hypothetical protein